MKRFAALLTAFLFLITTSALAFSGAGYPAWDGRSAADSSFCGAFDGQPLLLTFDPSEDYSNVMDGLIQACFFAYDEAETSFLEVYLLIPDDVAAGDVLRSGDIRGTSIALYETTMNGDTVYFADDLEAVTANGSGFEMTIETMEFLGSMVYMSGSLTAQLSLYELEQARPELLTISDAHFSFVLSMDANPFASLPDSDSDALFPDLPDSALPDLPGAPAFTLPPNYVTL